jgi:flagellum-specific peptidoglycan hydrolase FlgJ
MEQTKLKRFKRILFILILAIVLGTGTIMYTTSSCNAVNTSSNVEKVDTLHKVVVDTVAIKDSIAEEIMSEVAEYLKKQSPNAHKFIPKYLVQAGLNHNIDICFMMAQTQIETNFGTMGAGRESSRRSLFGVAVRRYGDYESAINDYCKLLHKSYLGKGRTEKHLMTKYVTHSGARYAGNPNYEAELSRTYRDIIRKTNIQNLQAEWNKM